MRFQVEQIAVVTDSFIAEPFVTPKGNTAACSRGHCEHAGSPQGHHQQFQGAVPNIPQNAIGP